MVEKIPEITLKLTTVTVKAKTRKRRINVRTEHCVIPVSEKFPLEKIAKQLSTHFNLKGDLSKSIEGTSIEIKIVGVCVDFLNREFYSLREVDWSLHQRVMIQMTPRKAKNHYEKYKVAFTSAKFGL